MLRIDPSQVDFRRYAQLRGVASLLEVWPRPKLRRLRVLDSDAHLSDMTPAVPQGTDMVRLAGAADAPPGSDVPHFDPTLPDPPGETYHVVVAGPSVARRGGSARQAALRGLLARTRSVLVVFLPPAGALGELACQLVGEFLAGLEDVPDHLGVAADQGAPPPPDVEELAEAAGAAKLHVQMLPARDPVGGLALSMLEVLFRRHPAAPRLRELLSTFHNTALVEAGPALRPLYQDVALLYPGRSSPPAAVRRLLHRETLHRYRPDATDLAALQLVLELEKRTPPPASPEESSEEDEGQREAREVARAEALQVELENTREALAAARDQVGEARELLARAQEHSAIQQRTLEDARADAGRYREALQEVHDFLETQPLLKAYLQKRGGTVPGAELLT
jgi:hypothetical protein